MISSVMMIGLAIALIRAYARYKSTGGHGKVLVLLLGSALIAVAVVSSWLGSRPPPEQFERSEWNRALGEMLGRQASKLVPEGGKVLVFVSPQVMAQRDQRLRVARVDQLQGLKIGLAKNLNLTVIEPQYPPIAMMGGIFNAPDLLAAVRAHPDAKVAVNFLPVHTQMFELLAQANVVLPKLITFSQSEKLAREAMTAGQVAVAVIARADKGIDVMKRPKGGAQQIFELRYRLLTGDSL